MFLKLHTSFVGLLLPPFIGMSSPLSCYLKKNPEAKLDEGDLTLMFCPLSHPIVGAFRVFWYESSPQVFVVVFPVCPYVDRCRDRSMVPVPAVRWKLPLHPRDRGVQDRGVQGLNEAKGSEVWQLRGHGGDNDIFPIGSMYGIYTYIWLIFMVNVGKYTIQGSSGFEMLGKWVITYNPQYTSSISEVTITKSKQLEPRMPHKNWNIHLHLP